MKNASHVTSALAGAGVLGLVLLTASAFKAQDPRKDDPLVAAVLRLAEAQERQAAVFEKVIGAPTRPAVPLKLELGFLRGHKPDSPLYVRGY